MNFFLLINSGMMNICVKNRNFLLFSDKSKVTTIGGTETDGPFGKNLYFPSCLSRRKKKKTIHCVFLETGPEVVDYIGGRLQLFFRKKKKRFQFSIII